jgi:hypothetical protein
VAADMILSADEFARLRFSSSSAEQERASKEAAPTDVWLDVIEKFPELREWVAHNKTVPVEVLQRLANDPNVGVRCTVATKRKLTPDLRKALANDAEPSVRVRLAYNAKCETEMLETLSTDPEPVVREAAIKVLSKRRGQAEPLFWR